jgi:hypothetical protein
MHVAPLAAALNTVLAGLPFAITEELDPGAVHEQVQGAIGTPITGQSVMFRSGRLNRAFDGESTN